MKLQIRQLVFESNSSSSHSIVITRQDTLITKEYIDATREEYLFYNSDKGVWDLSWDEEDLEFNRHPFKFLNTFADKVKFAIASFCGSCYGDLEDADKQFAEIEKIVSEVIPEIHTIKVPEKEEDLYVDSDGNEIWESKAHHDYNEDRVYYIRDGREIPLERTNKLVKKPYYGYVDHASQGLLQSFLKSEGITLKDFLTHKKYVIVIDGDEYCDWENFKYSGLINIENIEKEF